MSTVAPLEVATASASIGTSSTLVRSAADPAQSGIAKTSLAGFKPGNIISDAVFTDEKTMSEAQIQSFFNSKVSKCVVGKDENGKPFVCLKDFRINSVNMPADGYCSGYKGAANETAARIIYKVAQACNINPQVLIVMLQKEQGLVTHVWPSAWRYDMALGQGCPDTAPCDPKFVGFFHQIYGAGRQMQMYMEGKWFTWYAPGKTWGILYHPNASCGRGNVYIANKATSALYYYTPYQPNAAALRAGYGEGDGCSSYGNRNFYNYFTDWFGSTQNVPPTVEPPVLSDINSTSYLVAANAGGTAYAYPYTKSTWGKTVTLATGLGKLSGFFDIGDLDGDGRRDFIAVAAGGKPSVLYGGDKTTVSAPVALSGTWTGVVSVLPAGDFNGDGLQDIFTTDSKGNLYLRPGNGLGGFGAARLVGTGWSSMSQLTTGVDFDNDGKPDVVARTSTGVLKLYQGNGKGGWGTVKQIGKGWGSMTSIFSPGDFTGDGKADILAHGADGALLLYKGTGAGNIAHVGPAGTKWNGLISKSAVVNKITALPALQAGAGNLDSALGRDIVSIDKSGNAYIYGGNGVGGWASSKKIASGWGANDTLVALGDFDSSGTSDYGRIDASGRFYMYSGASATATQIGKGWTGYTHVFGGLDYDGDRKSDVVAVTASGVMYLYKGNGAGGFSGDRVQIGKGWTGMANVFYAGDFNGDGNGDVIARLADGTLRLYPMNGNGGWGAATQIGKGWSAFTHVLSPGDFTGDGRSDVIGIRSDGAMFLYQGNGKGGWSSSKQIGKGWGSMSRVI